VKHWKEKQKREGVKGKHWLCSGKGAWKITLLFDKGRRSFCWDLGGGGPGGKQEITKVARTLKKGNRNDLTSVKRRAPEKSLFWS